MSEIKVIEKLREWSHYYDNVWARSDGKVATYAHAEYREPDMKNIGDALRELADEIEAEIAERYMPLPVDADGVPIFIGDLLKSDETNEQFMCRGYSVTLQPSDNCKWWTVECSYDGYSGTSEYVSAKSCHHVKERTIEDMLIEMLETAVGYSDAHTTVAYSAVEKYADELRDMMKEGGND